MEVNRSREEQEAERHTRKVPMSGEPAPAKTRKRSNVLDTRAPGHWIVLARGVWLALVVLTLAIFFASLPVYMAQLQTPCAGSACGFQQLTPEHAGALKGMGLSLGDYTAYTIALTLATMGVCLVVSTVIVLRRSDDRMALLVALLLVTLGPLTATFNVSGSPSPWQVPNDCLSFLFLALFLLVFSLFPSGQFVPHWTRWTIVVFLAAQAPFFFPDALSRLNIYAVSPGYLLFLGEAAILVVVQLYRYRRVSNPLQRQQTKWVIFGFAVPITVYVLGIAPYLSFSVLAGPGSLYLPAFLAIQDFLLLLIPLSFGFAILRYRLWEIDFIINRTLVYGALTAIVVGAYILVVGILGTFLHTSGDIFFSLLATGLVAVLFQPLRARLQHGVNRLMYGERDEPYAVLSRLLKRLEATLAPEAVLPAIVETIAQALRLPYAAITLSQGDVFTPAATFGLPQERPFTLPLVYHTETIGQLLLAPRAPGDAFTAADQRLLEDIARQAGVAVHAVRLTADLQRSREHLVTAREEERRRFRRDLHDGLGPTLASMTLKLDAARLLLTQNPSGVAPLLVELKAQMQETIVDIRRLVYDLRPPALDELGLVSALRSKWLSIGSSLRPSRMSLVMPGRRHAAYAWT
jgi:signal transduction histidine kinase